MHVDQTLSCHMFMFCPGLVTSVHPPQYFSLEIQYVPISVSIVHNSSYSPLPPHNPDLLSSRKQLTNRLQTAACQILSCIFCYLSSLAKALVLMSLPDLLFPADLSLRVPLCCSAVFHSLALLLFTLLIITSLPWLSPSHTWQAAFILIQDFHSKQILHTSCCNSLILRLLLVLRCQFNNKMHMAAFIKWN